MVDSANSPTPTRSCAMADDESHVAPSAILPPWLEQRHNPRVQAWVEQCERQVRKDLLGDEVSQLAQELRAVLDAPDRIPPVSHRAGMLYNHWFSREHPRGLWRRATWESFVEAAPLRADRRAGETTWETLLDLDKLASDRGAPVTWVGAQVLTTGPDAGHRALITLSEGGRDATTTEEFDLDAREFIPEHRGGFVRRSSKGSVKWADESGQRVLESADFGAGSLTAASYPRQVRRRSRPSNSEEFETLLTAPAHYLAAAAARDAWSRTWLTAIPTLDTTRIWLLPDAAPCPRGLGAASRLLTGEGAGVGGVVEDDGVLVPAGAVRLDVPVSSSAGVGEHWLTVELRESWNVGGQVYPAGALLAAPLDAYLAGERCFEVLFSPTDRGVLQSAFWTRRHLVLRILDDVVTRLMVCTPPAGGAGHWTFHDVDLTGAADFPTEGSVRTRLPVAREEAAGETVVSNYDQWGEGSESDAYPTSTVSSDNDGHPAPAQWQEYSPKGHPLRPGRALLTVSCHALDPAHTDFVWLSIAGWTTPSALAVARISETGELSGLTMVRQAPARFDARYIDVTQHVAYSQDGSAIPYFQVGPRHTSAGVSEAAESSGQAEARVLVDVYGAFGANLAPVYDPALGKGWLESGGAYVVANVRGGGEYGAAWHSIATGAGRHLPCDDTQAVLRALVARGVTRPELITLRGASAGGLVVGHILTRQPQLIGSAILEAPLLDLERFTRLSAGPSWVSEFGDPTDPTQWEWMRAHSPIHTLTPGSCRPPTLIVTRTNDDRVHPYHGRSLAWLMQHMGYPVWYLEEAEGGHHGFTTSSQRARTLALMYRFARTAPHLDGSPYRPSTAGTATAPDSHL